MHCVKVKLLCRDGQKVLCLLQRIVLNILIRTNNEIIFVNLSTMKCDHLAVIYITVLWVKLQGINISAI
jgi:hypothetical protein